MPADLQPSHGAFIATALILTLTGLCLSFFLVRLFRKRLGDTRVYTTPLVVGHLIAYTFLLYSWKSGAINEGTIRAGLITLSVIPAFIVASSAGRVQAISQPAPVNAEKVGESEVPTPEEKADAEPRLDIPARDEKPQTFSEGMIKGVWAFVAIWIFYIFNFSLFGLILRIAQAVSSQG